MSFMNDTITVVTQSNDGHGWSLAAVMLSVSSPKAAKAIASCVNRSADDSGMRKGKGAGVEAA